MILSIAALLRNNINLDLHVNDTNMYEFIQLTVYVIVVAVAVQS